MEARVKSTETKNMFKTKQNKNSKLIRIFGGEISSQKHPNILHLPG